MERLWPPYAADPRFRPDQPPLVSPVLDRRRAEELMPRHGSSQPVTTAAALEAAPYVRG